MESRVDASVDQTIVRGGEGFRMAITIRLIRVCDDAKHDGRRTLARGGFKYDRKIEMKKKQVECISNVANREIRENAIMSVASRTCSLNFPVDIAFRAVPIVPHSGRRSSHPSQIWDQGVVARDGLQTA